MPLKHPSVACPLDLIMPGAAPYLKRFARHPHAVQHQGGATATRAVRAMTRQEGYTSPPACQLLTAIERRPSPADYVRYRNRACGAFGCPDYPVLRSAIRQASVARDHVLHCFTCA